MGVMDYMKAAAMNFIAPPKKKQQMNVTKPDMGYGNPTYQDLNKDGQDPMLRPKKIKPNVGGIHLFNPAKDSDRDISRDKHGHYVQTMTYPLPPISKEKKEFMNNRRARNSKNNYL